MRYWAASVCLACVTYIMMQYGRWHDIGNTKFKFSDFLEVLEWLLRVINQPIGSLYCFNFWMIDWFVVEKVCIYHIKPYVDKFYFCWEKKLRKLTLSPSGAIDNHHRYHQASFHAAHTERFLLCVHQLGTVAANKKSNLFESKIDKIDKKEEPNGIMQSWKCESRYLYDLAPQSS